jgi:DNA-binding response OmpR family regulator
MSQISKQTIVVCDDDEGIVDFTTIILNDLGYQVESATNGQEALEVIRATQPDLILLDLWLPILSGEEIMKELKKTESTCDIPVIVVSARKDTAEVATRSQAASFLCKPYDISELEGVVKKYLNKNT